MPSSIESTKECTSAVQTTPSWVQDALAEAHNDTRDRPWKNAIKEAPVNEGMTDKPDVVTVKDDLSMMMSTLAA
jgi:hypothetical protein